MAKDTDRNSDGTFARKDDAGGGEDTPAATERDIETVQTSGGEEEKAEFLESFDKPGLSEAEGGSRIEQMLKAAAQEPDEVPEGADPEALEQARATLEEEGSIEAAQETLEQNLKQSEAEQAEAEAAEGPDPVPFEHLASDLGFDDPQQAADAVEVTITVDGEQETVPISELAESGMRQADYTRKTQQLSEEKAEVQQAKEAYAQQLEMLATTIGQNLSPQQQQALVQEYNRVVSEVSEAATPDPESVQEEQEQLRQTFDGWESDSEWQEARSNIREYAHDLGFSDQDLASVTDHRLLTILEKSRRYDQLAESTEGLEDERGPSKTLKPGVDKRTAESVERTRQRRREEGRRGHSKPALKMSDSDTIDDAADRIAGILEAEGS